ncbi:RNA-dependent RNA polymerase [Estero Real virus]|uniref:RNA-directed RNA polymerase L n=1 Tax=Estero Real virus TaxID=2170057 RepID=A0A346JIY0_9VIRU|nr:RNA-dependent RNA polymerase [Estero Real virus]AXP33563.1 RNA-dependent RNA polymerase [Estero Real virus]
MSNLDNVIWRDIGPNKFGSDVRLALREYFTEKQVIGDGNCFYRAISLHIFQKEDEWRVVKDTVIRYADTNWNMCQEARIFYNNDKEAYLEDVCQDGYWGGTTESEILALALNTSIIIWHGDGPTRLNGGTRYGQRIVSNSINLVLRNGHFNYLDVTRDINPDNAVSTAEVDTSLALELISTLDAATAADDEGELLDLTTLETREPDVLEHSSKNDLRSQLFSKPTATETIKKIKAAIKEGEHLSVKIGRIINRVFDCEVGFTVEENHNILLVRLTEDSRGVKKLSKLRYNVLDEEGNCKEDFKKSSIIITSSLQKFVNIPELLRLTFPSVGISKFGDLIHPRLLFDILEGVVVILLSSFLYNTEFKVKRKFILNTITRDYMEPTEIAKILAGIGNTVLYQQPDCTVRTVLGRILGRVVQDTYNLLRNMPASGILAIRNIDMGTMSWEEYRSILEDLQNVSADYDVVNQDEIQEIKHLMDAVESITPPKLDQRDYSEFCRYMNISDVKEVFHKRIPRNPKDFTSKLISHFFKKKLMVKFVSLQGKAYSGATLNNVLAYCNNLYLTRDQLNFTPKDTDHLTAEMIRIRGQIDEQSVEPIAMICTALEDNFEQLFKSLPGECEEECRLLYNDVRNSDNHSSAWKAALRIKGVAYEGLFAKTYGWTYTPEDRKPTLSMLFQTLYPDKFISFLERTQTYPEIRDLTPDFVLTQSIFSYRDAIKEPSSTEQVMIEWDADVSEAKPSFKKAFPLPDQDIKEVLSLSGVAKVFKKGKPERATGSMSALVDESMPEEEATKELREIVIVEVGYQTDVEGKITADAEKWKSVLNLFRFFGIRATIISCADSSENSNDDWWIPSEMVVLLKKSTSFLFKKLQDNTPADVTELVVGSISTHKIRSMLKSGFTVRTPVTIKEVRDTWNKDQNLILHRPTGVKLPSQVAHNMQVSLVEGAVMESEASKDLYRHIIDNLDLIGAEFERTKFKHSLNKPIETSQKLLLGWLSEDLKACRCKECLEEIQQLIDQTEITISKIQIICRELQVINHKECCHTISVSPSQISKVDCRTCFLSETKHSKTQTTQDELVKETPLDRLVKLTLPGKTEKERKVKRGVEQLTRLSMSESGINCIKNSAGQVIISKGFFSEGKESKLKSKVTEDDSNKEPSIGKDGGFLTKLKQTLSASRLSNYSEYARDTIKAVLDSPGTQQNSKCCLKDAWVKQVFFDLKTDNSEMDLILKLKEGFDKKKNFSVNNDKTQVLTAEAYQKYIESKAPGMFTSTEPIFGLDEVIFKQTMLEAINRYFSTPYWSCPSILANLTNLLLKFNWFQRYVLYGKICETFLQACTEFRRSGIKIMKIRHTNLNLAIKLPSNKKENMTCVVYSKDFSALCNAFKMNRRVAVLGASYYYIIIVLFIQCLQQYRCVKVLENEVDLSGKIDACVAQQIDELIKMIGETTQGEFELAQHRLFVLCQQNGNFLNRSTYDHFITCFAGLSMVYGLILGDALLLNSQPFNKQIQMMRFSMLNGISRLSSPYELGKKFSSSCRTIEAGFARLYLQLISYSCGRDPEKNIKAWKQDDLCPNISMPSLSIFGHFINSDRQLVFDIYNVHIYNKEMDNFDEGTIKVLEETAERHMTWEMDILKSLGGFDEASKTRTDKTGEQKDKDYRTLRLLLGVGNIKKSSSGVSSIEDETLSATSGTSVKSSSSTKQRLKTYFGRLSMQKKPFSLSDSFEVSRNPTMDYREAISDKTSFNVYKPKETSVMRDIISIVRKNPSHTMGSFELIQCFTEQARVKFPIDAIEKAKRDPSNYVTVSEVTETTSIVSDPKTHFSVKDSLRILSGQENKKIVKLIKGRLQRIGASTGPKESKLECLKLLETIDCLSLKQRKDIALGLNKSSNLAFYTWKDVVCKGVETALITDDANYIHCWLKSLGSQVKKGLKPYIKNLRYDLENYVPKFNKIPDGITEAQLAECVEFIDNLKKICRGEVIMNDSCSPNTLKHVWKQFCRTPKLASEILNPSKEDLAKIIPPLRKLNKQYKEFIELKDEFPNLSFGREEVEIRSSEQCFINECSQELMRSMTTQFFICLCCPWCIHYKSLENFMRTHLNDDCKLDVDDLTTKKILEISLEEIWLSLLSEDLNFNPEISIQDIRMLVKYLSAIFASNSKPISCALNSSEGIVKVKDQSEILSKVNMFVARTHLESDDYDFLWTCHMISNSNFEVTKRLTGRSTGERLPRSVRSKVIYEIIRVVGESGTAILQQLAFSAILNQDHRLFAVLAPKAQLGGHRDLLVQETQTKLIHATSEMFSRSLLKTTNDDGLTNPHLKEQILSTGLSMIEKEKILHGTKLSGSSCVYQFFRVCAISGDNTKWGPIHCCSLFSGMMQQLLKDSPDWSNFYKLVFLKNLYREIEIPAGSIKKIINVLRYTSDQDLERMSEPELRNELKKSLEHWNHNPIVQFLISTYLANGKMALNSYNHMGQGIHHATSSVLTSIMGEVINNIITEYLGRHFKELTSTVYHAGSSDDYAKVIVLSGQIPKDLFEQYEGVYWERMCKLKNIIAGIGRACQMKDSAKTLVGDAFVEFYSEFMLSHRTTPAVIKFILTGLINSSVTSPQSMSQACHVSAQQALYNSVPLLTNFTFTLLRQQMFMNHTEAFHRNYGLLVQGSLSSFGRTFIPKLSGLIGSSVALEDSEEISKSCTLLAGSELKLGQCALSDEGTVEPREEHAEVMDDLSLGKTPSSSRLSSMSLSSGSSFKFGRGDALTSAELEYLKKCRPESIELVYTKQIELLNNMYGGVDCNELFSSVLNSNIVNSCELFRNMKENPWYLMQFLRAVLNIVIAGHYRTFSSEGTEKTVKANLNRDENTVIEDPMIQLIPEKLRRELERLGLSKMTIEEMMPIDPLSDNLAEVVAKRIVMLNCATEDYSSEVSRLKQTLTSRNVIHGLAGGIKELSVPIYTIFLKSYFFKDKVFFQHYDRWSTSHSKNYRDSSGKSLEGKTVVKFTTWLDCFLNSDFCYDPSPDQHADSLFDPRLKGISVVHVENGCKQLALHPKQVICMGEEFKNVALQFSDVNRHKLVVLESERHNYQVDANKAVITKSTLFSSSDSVKLENSPAVVVSYIMSETAILSVKPTKINMASLIRDRFKLMMFYKTIMDLVQQILKESEQLSTKDGILDIKMVDRYANGLTMLCRLIQKAKPTLTSFYLIKAASYHNEPTVNDLISYGVIEGSLLVLKEPSIDTSTYSIRYWKILQCICAISCLPIKDAAKTSMLCSFLNWKPDITQLEHDCPLELQDKQISEEFNDRMLVNVLSSELAGIKKEKERESLKDLIDYVTSPRQLIARKPYLGTTTSFVRWGSGTKDGRFTFSSSSGEASGIFICGYLHLVLSNDSTALLHQVERKVLEWLNHLRTDTVTVEHHNVFCSLLCSTRFCSKKYNDGKVMVPEVDSNNPRFLKLKRANLKQEQRVVRVKPGILSVRKEVVREVRSEPKLLWKPGLITIIYDEQTENPTYHEKLALLTELVNKTILRKDNTVAPSVLYKDTRIVLTKVSLPEPLYLSSISLLHCFLSHAVSGTILEASSKSATLQYYISNRSYDVKKLFEMSTHQEIGEQPDITSACQELQSELNRYNLPMDCWAELQRVLDENGYHKVQVGLSQKGNSSQYSWELLVKEQDVTSSRHSSLKEIILCTSSSIIPRQFIPFLYSPCRLKDILTYCDTLKLYINQERLTDQEVDFSFLCILYCLQSNSCDETEVRLSKPSLQNLLRVKTFSKPNINFEFIFDDDIVALRVDIMIFDLSSSTETVNHKAIQAVAKAKALAFVSEFFTRIEKVRDLKAFVTSYDTDIKDNKVWINMVLGSRCSKHPSYLKLSRIVVPRLTKDCCDAFSGFYSLLTGQEYLKPPEIKPPEEETIRTIKTIDLLESSDSESGVEDENDDESNIGEFDW